MAAWYEPGKGPTKLWLKLKRKPRARKKLKR